MGRKKKFVIVFVVGGKIFVDYGWAAPSRKHSAEGVFLGNIGYRLRHPERYPAYHRLPTTRLSRYEIRDIAGKTDDEIFALVERMKREVGSQPVR